MRNNNFHYCMKNPNLSTILWILYEWGNNWYGYRSLAKYTRMNINDLKKNLRFLISRKLLHMIRVYDKKGMSIGYYLHDKTRKLLDNYDTDIECNL